MVNREVERIVSDRTLSQKQKKDLLISKITQNLENMSVTELAEMLNQTEKTSFVSSLLGNGAPVRDIPIINARELPSMEEESFVPLTESEALVKKAEYEALYNKVNMVPTEHREWGKKPQKGYTFFLYGKKENSA